MTCHAPIKNDLIVGPNIHITYAYEQIDNFRYLGVNINYNVININSYKIRLKLNVKYI